MQEKSEPIGRIKSVFDEISVNYDKHADTFEEKVESYVTWEHLKEYLPENKDATILDAGGGTGKWALPLARLGYRVVLCDISKGMLRQAEEKIRKEGLSDKVEIKEVDITNLPFGDNTFDFVFCEGGPVSISDSQSVISELGRVLKREGKVWATVTGRYPLALKEMRRDSKKAIKLVRSETNFIPYKGIERNRIFSPEEIKMLFRQNGIEVIRLYGDRIITLFLPEEVKAKKNYNEVFFSEIAEIALLLSEEPSVLGIAESLKIVGKKR